MLFVQYDTYAVPPGLFQPVQNRSVQRTSRPEAYLGRQLTRVSRIGTGKQTEPGFSNILAEEEDAILTRLQTA